MSLSFLTKCESCPAVHSGEDEGHAAEEGWMLWREAAVVECPCCYATRTTEEDRSFLRNYGYTLKMSRDEAVEYFKAVRL